MTILPIFAWQVNWDVWISFNELLTMDKMEKSQLSFSLSDVSWGDLVLNSKGIWNCYEMKGLGEWVREKELAGCFVMKTTKLKKIVGKRAKVQIGNVKSGSDFLFQSSLSRGGLSMGWIRLSGWLECEKATLYISHSCNRSGLTWF